MKHSILLICAAISAWGQAPPAKLNCDTNWLVRDGWVSYCEMRETSVPFNGSIAVTTGGSGDVTVQPWDGGNVLVREQVRTAAGTMSLAVELAAMVTLDTTDGNLTGSGPESNRNQNWAFSLEIYVPRTLGLSVRTLNGNVSIQDLAGQPGIMLATVNGNLSASNVTGPMQLVTTNGNISTAGGKGLIQFDAVNGQVSLKGVAGDVQGSVVNGGIVAATDHWVGQNWTVQSVNGTIELDVPHDCAAHAELSTLLGPITTNLPIPPAKPNVLGRTVAFDIGGGGSSVRASVVVGSITLTRLD